jgi:hypothetical protein
MVRARAASRAPKLWRDSGNAAWRRAIVSKSSALKLGLPVHLVNHLATMADLHRAGSYDRLSDKVLTLTGQGPMSVQEFVRKNAAAFTASAKAT